MAYLELRLDTAHSGLGFLSPLDLELASAIVDIFYIVCLRQELLSRSGFGPTSGPIPRSIFPRRSIITREYDAKIEVINFSNPLTVGAFFRNVTVENARRVLDRTLFYTQERERRILENEITRQNLIALKLKNIQKAIEVRKKLISSGFSEDDATRAIGSVLLDEKMSLEITDSH